MNAAAEPPVAGTVPVTTAREFDRQALADWLKGRLDGAEQSLAIRQFKGGQSNPTFLLTTGAGGRFVLRKKPAGTLLARAHQVEREYAVMQALAGSGVAVPRMLVLCEDAGVIGTAFYVMDYVPGRVLGGPDLGPAATAERRPLYHAMIETLAALHRVDFRDVGLADFGRPDGYVARQIARWSRQYEASRSGEDSTAMDWLRDWLHERAAVVDETAIVHGDFRFGNVILEPERPAIAAVLDWELSTIGHPLADLAYFCLPYHLPHGIEGIKGLGGLDLQTWNIPTETETIERYADLSGRDRIDDWPLFLAFSFFRLAAILQGVHARALQGNASSDDALAVGRRAGMLAEAGRRVAREASR